MADDQPMWGNNRAVAPTPGAAIVAVDLGDNFTVKGHHLSMIKDRQFDGCSRADPHKHIAEFVEVCRMFRYGNTNADAIKLKLFSIIPSRRSQDLVQRTKSRRDNHLGRNETSFRGPKEEEANYASGGYQGGYRGNYYGQNSINWHDRQSYHRDENRNSNPGDENRQFHNQFYNLKTKVKQGQKNHQAAIQDLETKFGRISEIFKTRDGKTYDPPANPNTKTAVFFDNSKHEAEEVEKEAEPLPKKLTQTDTLPLKAYKPKIPYPQCLNKEKIEARYAMFLDMIKEVRINIPLVDVLAGMPNYGKFLKDLVSNKSKMEQISAAFLTEECSAILQNKIPPKLGDPGNFVILQIEEDDRVPLILGRPFLHTADAIIRVKNKELNLGIGEDRATFHIDKAM
ncbi:hypothetical protein Tco_0528735 [Tanacetum coccineum]